jgi:hypothetical protein
VYGVCFRTKCRDEKVKPLEQKCGTCRRILRCYDIKLPPKEGKSFFDRQERWACWRDARWRDGIEVRKRLQLPEDNLFDMFLDVWIGAMYTVDLQRKPDVYKAMMQDSTSDTFEAAVDLAEKAHSNVIRRALDILKEQEDEKKRKMEHGASEQSRKRPRSDKE